MILKLDYFNLI